MFAYLLLLIFMAISTTNRVINKLLGNKFPTDAQHIVAYNMITSTIASLFLFATAGFQLQVNLTTLVYAIVYSIVCAASVISIIAVKYADISLVGLSSSAGSLLTTTLFGVVYFQEPLRFNTVLPVLLMLIAVFLPARALAREKNKNNKLGVLLCVALFFVGGLGTIVSKLFAVDTRVTNSNSFFVLTNLFIFLVCTIVWFCSPKKEKKHYNPLLAFEKKQTVGMIITVVLSNIGSLLSIAILADLPISVYSLLTSSISVIMGLILSKCFKQPLTKEHYIGAVLAIIATIISVWEQLYLLVIS